MDELREKYLQGKMTEAERESFEQSLSMEEKEELAIELGIQKGLESGFRAELREKMAGFEKKGKPVRRINTAYISIAASIFIVASLTLYFTRDQQSLFDEYYQPYPNYEVTTVRGEEDSTSRMAAYAAYDVGNYELAISKFNEMEDLTAPDFFFRGVSNIQIGKLEEALDDFNKVLSRDDEDYKNASIWYVALIHLKQKDHEQAIPLLEQLSEGQSEFATTSTELLGKL